MFELNKKEGFMKKWGYIICCILIIGMAIFAGNYLYKSSNNSKENNVKLNTIKEDINIELEDNYSVKNDISIQTTTKEEKISPNAVLVLKKHYEECGHTIKQYSEIPQEFVNQTEEEFSKEYTNWTIEKFEPLEVVLIKNEQGLCDEHYVLKEEDGLIVVYKEINGELQIEEITGISVGYLTQEDKLKLEKGIKVYGKEELNSVLEDYE